MAKVLVFGDTHFRESAYLQGEELIEKGIKLAQKLKPDVTIVLGDLCDEHETLRTAPAKQVERFLRGLIVATSGMVYALMGNHDLIDNRQFLSENHFFGPYKEWEGLVIVDKPIIAYVGKKGTSKRGIKLVLCPFVEKGRFVEALDTLLYDVDPEDPEDVSETGEDWKDARCIFGHLEVKGVTYAGRISTNGDKWSPDYPMLISGHIHDECFIEPNVHYPGSSIQVAANEKPDKRVWLLTFADAKADGSDTEPKIKKYDLGLKTIKEVKLDCADAKTFDWSLTEKYIIKLVLSGTQEELSLFRKSQLYAKFKRLGVRVGFSAIVDESPVFLLTAGSTETKKQNPETMTFDQILRRLCRTKPDSVKQVYEKICGEGVDSDSESSGPDQGSDSGSLISDELSASEIDSAEFVFSDSEGSDDDLSSSSE